MQPVCVVDGDLAPAQSMIVARPQDSPNSHQILLGLGLRDYASLQYLSARKAAIPGATQYLAALRIGDEVLPASPLLQNYMAAALYLAASQ
jgi:hypothetical protein